MRRYAWLALLVPVAMTGCRSLPLLSPAHSPRAVDWSKPVEPSGKQEEPTTTVAVAPPVEPPAIVTQSHEPAPWTKLAESLPAPVHYEADRRWQPIFFAYNQYFIGHTERKKLEALAAYLRKESQYHLVIEGHCDERGSEEYNRALGERRALAVRDYMAGLQISGGRMQTISYGEERPADAGHTEEAYGRNRRAELIVVLPK